MSLPVFFSKNSRAESVTYRPSCQHGASIKGIAREDEGLSAHLLVGLGGLGEAELLLGGGDT